jgi:N6-L-threonylcarbamoyladenine synthase
MRILAIETSCDDTGVAILEASKGGDFKVLSNIVASQIIHQKYGGVFPAMAKREHQKNLVPAFIKALKEAKLLKPNLSVSFATAKNTALKKILKREQELYKKLIPFLKKYGKPYIDVIAVTNGPGLEPCLWVGVNFAKALSYFWNIPVVAVNHVESHILVNLLDRKKIEFPALALIVSGGHTQLVLVKGVGKYQILGETRDDAAGECFDKCAKLLGLGYPGGPIISKLAEGIKPKNILPRPMIGTKDYDFSFSGLKTAVLYQVKKDSTVDQSTVLSKKYKAQMAAEIQQAIIDVLTKKTIKAAMDYKVKTIILGGGVSANKELKKQFSEKTKKLLQNITLLVPDSKYCTDNGLMIAITGYYKAKQKKFTNWQDIKADSNLRIK